MLPDESIRNARSRTALHLVTGREIRYTLRQDIKKKKKMKMGNRGTRKSLKKDEDVENNKANNAT